MIKKIHNIIALSLAALILISSIGVVAFKMDCVEDKSNSVVSLWDNEESCTHNQVDEIETSCCHKEEKQSPKSDNKSCCKFSNNYYVLNKVYVTSNFKVSFNKIFCALPVQYFEVIETPLICVVDNENLSHKPPSALFGRDFQAHLQTYLI